MSMRILKGLSGRVLACGCMAGVYETYDGNVVTIIDVPGASCPEREHASGNIVPSVADLTHAGAGHTMAARD
jgi:hypothetical protein